MGDSVQDAMYKLTNVHVQIDAYCSDVIRSQVPLMLLDEAFEKKDDISNAIQKRLRDASVMAAEAEKIKVVKAAEAAADAAQLQGEGIARQRRAIVEGLRDSITHGTQETLSTEKVSELLLVTQYFETLRDIAATSKAQTVFI